MARAKHTYAVRLAVEGGNRVKADLTSVGTSGERSIKKIDRASDRASRGLGTLSDRASSLRRRMRLLGGVLAGVAGAAAVGGLAALVKRSIDAADSIVKTADKLGVGTAALQELRFAANLAGIEQTTLDMALQRFTRRAAEAAKGTGEAKDALKQMGIALKDQHGNIRRSEDLLSDVAEALKNTKDPAERLRLAFKLFDSEGVAMVNMLVAGGDALEAIRQRARDLGIVLDEELLRNAEKTKDQLTVLGTVLSANLNKAVLEHADAIGDLAERFTENLPTLIGWVAKFSEWVGLIERPATERLVEIREEIALLEEVLQRSRGIRGFSQWLNDLFGMGPIPKGVVESRFEELRAEAAELERQLAKAAVKPPAPITLTAKPALVTGGDSLMDDEKAANERARRILQIEKRLNQQLFQLRHEGAERIRVEHLKLVTELQYLIAPDGSNLDKVERLLIGAASVRDDKLAQLARREAEAVERRAQANRRILEGLQAERDALAMTDRQRFVSQALRRLSAEATEAQRGQVRELAGVLYDEQQAIEARNRAEQEAGKLREKGKALTDSLRTAEEAYKTEMADLNQLLNEGAIAQETFARASEDAYERMLRANRDWSAGVTRALRDYGREAGDAARQFENVTSSALKASEDAWVNWAKTGKLSVADFFSTLADAALRAAYRLLIFKPLEGFLEGLIGSISFDFFGSSSLTAPNNGAGLAPQYRSTAFAHGGGVVGVTPLAHRPVDPAVFGNAPRFHSGGLVSGDVPVIAKQGEVIGWPEQMREAFGSEVVVQVIDQRSNGARPEVSSERGPDGRRIVRVLIRDEVNRGIAQGAFDQSLSGAFGINRRGVPR